MGALIIPLLVFVSAIYGFIVAKPWTNPGFDKQIAGASYVEPVPGLPANVAAVDPEEYIALPNQTSVEAVASSYQIAILPEDVVTTFPDLAFGVGGKVKIYRAQAVLVTDYGSDRLYHTWQTDSRAFLDEAKIELGDQDKISAPDTLQTLTRLAPVSIKITRVEETEVVTKEAIPYKTVTKADPTREKGTKTVSQKGRAGQKKLTYLVRRENGQETSRKLLKTEIALEPTDEIVLEGTKVIVYGSGIASWYTKKLNHVAAHNTLPRGTKVRVVSESSGKSTVVTVVGGGIGTDALIDLSYDAFSELASPGAGRIKVRVEKFYE